MKTAVLDCSVAFALLVFIHIQPSHAGDLTTAPSASPQVQGSEPLRPAPGTEIRPAKQPRPESRPRALRPDFAVGNVRYYLPQRQIRFDVSNLGDIYSGELVVRVHRSGGLDEWKRQTVNLPRNRKIEMSVPFDMPDANFVCSLDIEVTADPQNRIAEGDETNNSYLGPIYRDVRAYFLVLPYELNLLLQRKRFTRACNTSPGPLVVMKNHLGTDYDSADKTARIKIGIPLTNCGSGTGGGDLSLDLFHTAPGGGRSKLFELPDFAGAIRLGCGQSRLFEKAFVLRVRQGTYRAVVRKAASVLCSMEWEFHQEFF